VADRDPHEAVREAENALRELISSVLQRDIGPDWLDKSGLSAERLARLPDRLREEQQRRPLQKADSRPIYYTDLPDLTTIVSKHWDKFKPFLGDKKDFDVFIGRLEDLRNPEGHHRGLWPYEVDLAFGISGTFRQALASARSELDQLDRHYPRFEEITDNFGNSWTPSYILATMPTKSVVHSGDRITFRIDAWNPTPEPVEFEVWVVGGTVVHWTTQTMIAISLADEEINRSVFVEVKLRSARDRLSNKSVVPSVTFAYAGIP
jgi:Swt1-like HEPN